MSFPLNLSPMRRVFPLLMLGSTVLLAAGTARAQATNNEDQSSTKGYSSSQDGLSASGLQLTEFALPAAPEPDGSAGEGTGAGQYGNGGGGGGGERHGLLHSWAF